MTTEILFTPYSLGSSQLKNRVVMAPMTRSRSPGNVPNELVAEYYGQRAEAGLIITEGTSPSPNGLGYARIPGLYDAAQVAGWRLTTDAVHAKGSMIFIQLMHTGRVSHPANLPAGAKLLGPSPIAAPGTMWTDANGLQPFPVPTEMSASDISTAIEEYVTASQLAIAAGFDGVELHGANGYLIEQFLNVASNKRTDEWGGSVANRLRFAVEVATRVAARIGGKKLGIRLSPYGAFNGSAPDAATDEVYETLAKELKKIGLVYIHVVDHERMGAPPVPVAIKDKIHDAFGGTIILSGGYDRLRAEADLEAKRGELVAFGRPFMANPNLVTKLKGNQTLRAPDMETAYTPGPKGYTDYPVD